MRYDQAVALIAALVRWEHVGTGEQRSMRQPAEAFLSALRVAFPSLPTNNYGAVTEQKECIDPTIIEEWRSALAAWTDALESKVEIDR